MAVSYRVMLTDHILLSVSLYFCLIGKIFIIDLLEHLLTNKVKSCQSDTAASSIDVIDIK